ncbi:MAG: type II toxin-antitoxin system HicB family antitoxin [Bacteroidota bacterium]
MDYLVIIEKTDTGYSAYVPDLPGCITVGDTKEEVQAHRKINWAILISGIR